MSYSNLVLYGASLPTYSSGKDKGNGGKDDEIIRADDPRNNDRVQAFIDASD